MWQARCHDVDGIIFDQRDVKPGLGEEVLRLTDPERQVVVIPERLAVPRLHPAQHDLAFDLEQLASPEVHQTELEC